jgi:transposase InsO family protein
MASGGPNLPRKTRPRLETVLGADDDDDSAFAEASVVDTASSRALRDRNVSRRRNRQDLQAAVRHNIDLPAARILRAQRAANRQSDFIPELDLLFPSVMAVPRLVGTDTLPKINVKATDLKRELESVFDAYENFFTLNRLADDNLVATSVDNGKLMASLLRQYIGRDTLDAIHPDGRDRTKSYNDLKTAIEAKFRPTYSERLIRNQFFQCTMLEGQTSRAFLQQCWEAIRRTSCTDANEQLEWVLTCFTTRHLNEEVRKVFDLKAPRTEAEALQIADDVESKIRERAMNAKVQAVLQTPASGSADVETVNTRFRNNNGGRNGGNRGGGARGTRGKGGDKVLQPGGNDCPTCGRGSRCPPGQCPAQNQNCYECGRRGHLGRVCFERRRRLQPGSSRDRGPGNFSRRSTNECDAAGYGYSDRVQYENERRDNNEHPYYVQQDEVGYYPHHSSGRTPAPSFQDVHSSQLQYLQQLSLQAVTPRPQQLVPKVGGQQASTLQMEPMHIDEVSKADNSRAQFCGDMWFEKLRIGSYSLAAKIDTGARVNVMSRQHFLSLGLSPNHLRPSPVVLVSFNKTLIQPLGMFEHNFDLAGVKMRMIFHVVPTCNNVLVCFRDAVRAQLLFPRVKFPPRIHDPVDALSIYKGETYSLVLADDAVPRTFPARKVPLAQEEEVKEELDRMEREGVITRVTEPTDWCSPMIVRRKPNGLLRVCMDPRYLNTFLKRATYPLPDVDQVFTKFRGAKFFSKMDLTMGFWQVLLDEKSSYLCTFSTPYGRYRYLRLPFGISPAPEVFHRMVADVVRDLPGVLHFVDDVLVWGNTKAEHDARLKTVLDRFARVNFTFNPAKCTFCKSEVNFLGHVVNGEHVRPDPKKVESVKHFPTPTNVDEVRRLLGVATYISKFIPCFSSKTAPLRRLLKADAAFVWTPEHDDALRAIKHELLDEKFLFIFDPRLPVQVATDACSTGLGAVLLQNDRPIAYAARSLTPAESNYSIIEKELLAVVFALTRFHFYTAGRKVTVLTDHQPLLGAARNVLLRDNPRLDRLFDKIIGYDLQWVYVPGKDNHFPDFLSRLPPACMPPAPSVSEVHEIAVAHGPTYDAIKQASLNDIVVSFVQECFVDGWPRSRAACPAFARFLWPIRHELRIVDGVLVDNNDRVYVPGPAQALVLREVHLGHPGLSTMAKRAHQFFLWPTMHADMAAVSSNCEICALHAPRHAREPLLCRPMPTRPGETIAADFFQIGSKFYLALYDVFSQFPMLWPVKHSSSHELLAACRVFFQFSGCPDHWWSDRGGAFDSHDFRTFAASIGMQLHFSSAEYPQSNGAAESAVKLLKRLRQVCSSEGDLFKATLYLQNTAKRTHTYSPAQVFLGRSARTPLNPRPTATAVSWEKHFHERISDQRAQSQAHPVLVNRSPPTFLIGDRVLVHNVRGNTLQGLVVGNATEPRSYVVEFPSGARSIRNRKFMTLLPRSVPPNAGRVSQTTTTPLQLPSSSPSPAPRPAPTDPQTTALQARPATPAPSPPSSSPRTWLPSVTASRGSQPLPTPTSSPLPVPRPSSPALGLPNNNPRTRLPKPPSSGRADPNPPPRRRPPSRPLPFAPVPVRTRVGRIVRQTWKLRDR